VGSQTTRIIIRLGISVFVFAIFLLHVAGALPLSPLTQLERLAYDARVRLTMPGTRDSRVVIVDIDEASISELGHWPWPRSRLARLTRELLGHYGARVVGFDTTFPESDPASGTKLLEHLASGPLRDDPDYQAALANLRPSLDYDAEFGQALGGGPTVLGFLFKARQAVGDEGAQRIGVLPPPAITAADNVFKVNFPDAGAYTGNLPVLQHSAAGGGFFDNPLQDADGVFRRVPLLVAYQGNLYGSLALQVLRAYLAWPPVKLVFEPNDPAHYTSNNLEAVQVGRYRIPVDGQTGALVPYRGPMRSFPYVSAASVLNGSAPADVLADSIVLIGTTAPGLLDLRATPVGSAYAGVEVHANLISGILDGRVKHHPDYIKGTHVVLLFLLGIVVTWVTWRWSILAATAATALLMAGYTALNLGLWQYGNFVIPLASPLLFTVMLFGLHTIYGFFVESRGKRNLSRMFGQYIPPELVEEMDDSTQNFSLEGESREMTVLFSDVRGFTSISEGLEPRALSQLMNEFLTPITRVIHQHRGTIDKYMGDAVMAFWGAPLADPEHARHGVEAALEMVATLNSLQPEFKRRGWPELRIGVGLNTGSMNVGNMGSQFRMAYTVLGDAVNLGSRLEGLTKQYGVDIIVSESTRAAVPDHAFLELDRVRVKGKEKPVAIYQPLGPKEGVDKTVRQHLRRYRQALDLYRHRDWDSAEREFFMLRQSDPGRAIYGVYLDRIAWFRQHPPPPDWDGVFVHTSK
jgi:adenylate cyclase